MKISDYFRILSLIPLICLNLSCDDGFLDRKPLDKISDEDVWNDEQLIELVVNTAYGDFHHGFYQPKWFMCLCDEAYRRGVETTHLINRGEMTPSNMDALNYWETYYKTITECNIFFAQTQNAEIDQAMKNRMTGEMKFLRAYAYFMLASFHGGVPLITEPFELDDDFGVPRNTYEQCMDFVVRELEEAATLLPLSYTGEDIGRLTRGAALALRSRALLYMASPLNNPSNDRTKWQAASDAAREVIDLGIYDLFPDYQGLFLQENALNEEIIWQRQFKNEIKSETIVELYWFPNGSGGYGQVHPLHNLADAYEMTSGLLPADDPAYDPQNPYVNRDPRFYVSISYNGAPWKGRLIETFLPGGLDSSEGPTGWNTSATGYYPRKFVDESITNPSRANTGNTPWTYLRYGEILLNYAEAQFYLGNEDVCRAYLNMIRGRASVQMPEITESGTELERRMQQERRIELVFEAHRYFDVRRWKIADVTENFMAQRMSATKENDGSITYEVIGFQERRFQEKNYLVPIPQDEIDKSPGLAQNPGY